MEEELRDRAAFHVHLLKGVTAGLDIDDYRREDRQDRRQGHKDTAEQVACAGMPAGNDGADVQMTGRKTPRLVVPISSNRPLPYSLAMSASICSFAYRATGRKRGLVPVIASAKGIER